MASEVAEPPHPYVVMFLVVVFTISCFLSLFAPRLWRKGFSKTWRWFARTSADGPCYRCCCTCMRRTVGRVTTGAPAAPTELRCRAVTSSNATLSWKHERESFLAEDSFELELNLGGGAAKAAEKEGEDGKDGGEGGTWLNVYRGTDTSYREKTLTPDTTFSARVRTVNHAGKSDWSEETQLHTRQLPVQNGGLGPAMEPAVAELIGSDVLAKTDNEQRRAYSWSQTDDEVAIRLACPAGCRGRDFNVEFRPTSLTVVHKPSLTTLLNGPLYANVKHSECTWDLEVEECVLVLGLEKSVKSDSIMLEHTERWSCVVAGHPQIDINIQGDERPSIQETLSKHLNR